MSKKAPWMAWYPADILTDAAYLAMTWEQRGMYRHLLDLSWINGGIPSDPAHLGLLLGIESSTAQALLETAFAGKWQPHPTDHTKLVNSRQELEREKQQKMAVAKAEAGSKGGKSRVEHANSLRSTAQALLKQTVPGVLEANSSQSQSQSQSHITTTTPPPPSGGDNAEKPSRRKGTTLCPDPFEITDEMAEFVRKLYPGITRATVQREHDRFMDWGRSGRKMKADWPATWRNWFRNAPNKSPDFKAAVAQESDRSRYVDLS